MSRPTTAPRVGRRKALWRWGRFVAGAAGAALVFQVLFNRGDELRGIGGYLNRLRPAWVALAVVCEAASLLAFAALQRRLLRSGGLRVGMGALSAITVAGNALSNSLPAGPAWATVYAFRRFRERGADETLASWTLLGVVVCSGFGLAMLAVVGVVVAGSGQATSDLVILIGVVAAIAIGAVVLVRRRDLLSQGAVAVLTVSRRLIHVPRDDPRDVLSGVATRIAAISPTRPQWAAALGWGMANWLGDGACMMLAFVAVGVVVPWRGLLLAYSAGQLAANLPVTPGGLGVVEGSLTIALVAYGGAEASTVAAVLLYRIISFWTMLPIGYAALGALALRTRLRRNAP